MVGVADPVGSGLVASLARPGGNVTGLANQIEIVSEKNLELLKQSKLGIKRVGIMFSPANAPSAKTAKAMQEAVGPRLGLTVVPVAVTKPEDFAGAFEMIIREQLEALHVLPVPVVFASRAKLSEFTLQQRLPTLSPTTVLGKVFLCHTVTTLRSRGLVRARTLIAYSGALTRLTCLLSYQLNLIWLSISGRQRRWD